MKKKTRSSSGHQSGFISFPCIYQNSILFAWKLKTSTISSQEEIEINNIEVVEIPSGYTGLIIGRHGANLRELSNETGAEVTRKDGEVRITKGTKKQRMQVKQLIGIRIVSSFLISVLQYRNEYVFSLIMGILL